MGQLSGKYKIYFLALQGNNSPSKGQNYFFVSCLSIPPMEPSLLAPAGYRRGGFALVGTPWRVGDMGGEPLYSALWHPLPTQIMVKKEK